MEAVRRLYYVQVGIYIELIIQSMLDVTLLAVLDA
jgi:hypothetical protein